MLLEQMETRMCRLLILLFIYGDWYHARVSVCLAKQTIVVAVRVVVAVAALVVARVIVVLLKVVTVVKVVVMVIH